MTLKKIEEQIDALGFPSLVNFLQNDSTHPSDMKYVLDDVERAFQQSSSQEFSKSDYKKVVKLVEQWFKKKHGKSKNPRKKKNPTYWDRRREKLGRPMGARGEAFDIVGNLGFQSAPYSRGGKNVTLYLYDLNDYDRRVYAHIPLKKGEKLYRFRTDRTYRAEPRSAILVKINVDKDLLYFMTEESAERDDPVFQTRGTKLQFLNLIRKNPRKKKNSDLDYLKAMVSIALNIKPDSEYISPTRQSQLADVARRLGFEWKYVKKVYKIDERINGKLPKKNGVKMPRMKKNPPNLGVRRIRSRYGVAGMIGGRQTSSSGVFKTKKQAERAIYYIESAFYDGTKGREYSYEEGRRYGYSAVDKYDQQGRLYDTVLADLTRKGAETLIMLLTQANKAGLKSKSNPKPSPKAGQIDMFTWRKLGFPINGKTAYVTQEGKLGHAYLIVKEGRKYALREFNSSLKLIGTFKTLAEAKNGFPKWLLKLESRKNPKPKNVNFRELKYTSAQKQLLKELVNADLVPYGGAVHQSLFDNDLTLNELKKLKSELKSVSRFMTTKVQRQMINRILEKADKLVKSFINSKYAKIRKHRKNKKPSKGKSKAQRRAQSNASKAMKLYQSGKAKSLKAAWRMVKRGS